MKRWTPWIIGAVIVIVLVARLGYRHVHALNEEETWYIAQLQYDFSARIDSVIRPGRALLRVTSGVIDADREWQLKHRLKAYSMLHLAIQRDSLYDLRVPKEVVVNDSVYINSDDDHLSVYRKGNLLVTRPLSDYLRGKPF